LAEAVWLATEFITGSVKLAVTAEFAVKAIEQLTRVLVHTVALPAPLLQPVNVEPGFATPWRVSAVPFG
jgi:hypothetical protein